MVGGHALADDAAGDRDELVIDVLDSQFLDLLADLFHQLLAALGIDVLFQVGHGRPPVRLLSFSACCWRSGVRAAAGLSSMGTGCWRSDAAFPRRNVKIGSAPADRSFGCRGRRPP